MIEIENIIPKYGVINNYFQNINDSKRITFEEQVYITDFFNLYKNAEFFYKMISTLIIEKSADEYNKMFRFLYSEIKTLQENYSQNKSLFDNLNVLDVCINNTVQIDTSIDVQTNRIQTINNKLVAINGKLESIAYKEHTTLEFNELMDEYSNQKTLLKSEQTKLNKLYDNKNKLRSFSFKYLDNIFCNFFKMNSNFMLILERQLGLETDSIKEPIFNLILTGKLYELCNDEIFKRTTDLNFYYILNLLPTTKKLEVIKGKQDLVFHLIKLLQTNLKEENNFWKKEFLEQINLTEKYKHKCSEVSNIINNTSSKKYNEYKNFDTELRDLIK